MIVRGRRHRDPSVHVRKRVDRQAHPDLLQDGDWHGFAPNKANTRGRARGCRWGLTRKMAATREAMGWTARAVRGSGETVAQAPGMPKRKRRVGARTRLA
jgi:hypothetical protein